MELLNIPLQDDETGMADIFGHILNETRQEKEYLY
jgi:hypothetical protein